MSVADVVALGYGSWGSIGDVTTLGYLGGLDGVIDIPDVDAGPGDPLIGRKGWVGPATPFESRKGPSAYVKYIDMILPSVVGGGIGVQGWYGGGDSVLPLVSVRARGASGFESVTVEV